MQPLSENEVGLAYPFFDDGSGLVSVATTTTGYQAGFFSAMSVNAAPVSLLAYSDRLVRIQTPYGAFDIDIQGDCYPGATTVFTSELLSGYVTLGPAAYPDAPVVTLPQPLPLVADVQTPMYGVSAIKVGDTLLHGDVKIYGVGDLLISQRLSSLVIDIAGSATAAGLGTFQRTGVTQLTTTTPDDNGNVNLTSAGACVNIAPWKNNEVVIRDDCVIGGNVNCCDCSELKETAAKLRELWARLRVVMDTTRSIANFINCPENKPCRVRATENMSEPSGCQKTRPTILRRTWAIVGDPKATSCSFTVDTTPPPGFIVKETHVTIRNRRVRLQDVPQTPLTGGGACAAVTLVLERT